MTPLDSFGPTAALVVGALLVVWVVLAVVFAERHRRYDRRATASCDEWREEIHQLARATGWRA